VRSASSSSHAGSSRVSATVPRQSTRVPSTSPRTVQTVAATPPRSASGATGSSSSWSFPGSRAVQPPFTASTSGPSGMIVGFRPSNSTVAPERALP
jgi:hypothetical protein